jgi:hypothetical protein
MQTQATTNEMKNTLEIFTVSSLKAAKKSKHLIHADGKCYIVRNVRKYDVVLEEPSTKETIMKICRVSWDAAEGDAQGIVFGQFDGPFYNPPRA